MEDFLHLLNFLRDIKTPNAGLKEASVAFGAFDSKQTKHPFSVQNVSPPSSVTNDALDTSYLQSLAQEQQVRSG